MNRRSTLGLIASLSTAALGFAAGDVAAQNMKSVRQVVESLTRVLEGKDISDLVAMAKSGSAASA